MKKIGNRKSEIGNPAGFTLIELLVVISIIAVLAAFTIPVLGTVKRHQNLKVARAEMERIETALENYHAKYGVYPPSNQNPNSNYTPKGQDRSQFSQLYYELSGVTSETIGGTSYFVTLDGSSKIKVAEVSSAYAVGGFVNVSKGNGEDAHVAENFLPDLKPNLYNSSITNVGPDGVKVQTTELVTSVGGPDQNYQPLGPDSSGINPFRYVYPGVHNPKSYDLWVQLVMSGKTNLICNWSDQVQINTSLP